MQEKINPLNLTYNYVEETGGFPFRFKEFATGPLWQKSGDGVPSFLKV